MPYSGGVFTRIRRWVGETNISASEFDADGDDVAAALSKCVLRDGTGIPTADISWNGRKITNLAAGVSLTDAVNVGQAQTLSPAINVLRNSAFAINLGGVSGTVSLGAFAFGHDGWRAGAAGCTYTFATTGLYTTITIVAGSLQQVIDASLIDGLVYTLSQAGTAQGRIAQGSTPSYATCPVSSGTLTANTVVIVEFSTGTVLKPQLQTGSSATAYSPRLATQEALWNSYYRQKILVPNLTLWAGSLATLFVPIIFPPMRANPASINPTFVSPSNLSSTGVVINSNTSCHLNLTPASSGATCGFTSVTLLLDAQV